VRLVNSCLATPKKDGIRLECRGKDDHRQLEPNRKGSLRRLRTQVAQLRQVEKLQEYD